MRVRNLQINRVALSPKGYLFDKLINPNRSAQACMGSSHVDVWLRVSGYW